MVLGVDEACTNVIRYAYRLRDDQLISLRMEGLRKCVRMRLRDYGEQVLPHEMKGRSHDMIKPGGLGLYLIRNAFDEVDYIHKRRGTELVLTKNLDYDSRDPKPSGVAHASRVLVSASRRNNLFFACTARERLLR